MSFVKKTKEFFGLAPYELEEEAAYSSYYEEPRYEGSAAYAPDYEDRSYSKVDSSRRDASASYKPSYPATIVPVSIERYNDATEIGNPVRDGDVVVFDVKRLSHDEAKRIIDFAAGLCFGLYSQMKKLDAGVFAIIPKGVDVTTVELERAAGLR
ncbi:DUF552 domain-containing protein [Corynebacterium sp. sy017]|uniref:cell division protein SepF n=1 Tax=unclassified Corynebacterium TaxID=2624378 RepID=UPI001185DF68|nr:MULTISPECIES: cell division protein SepF [unclassified Corynebacterium]MBP3087954.1 DUF552 domain-containing protein [Corynebacterium sp. sy017]QDZ42914.1 DUF552 domain-containing protein [Corynebacterium sp. sy039]TSD92488.1 DUF552 domain-containing protein [Corynebacterium sp. SY003]